MVAQPSPARLGVELATPVLSGYAARKPAQFLGIAAAVGAIVMVARPWRLISVTGLIVALLKSSQLSSVVMSAMSTADFKTDHESHDVNRAGGMVPSSGELVGRHRNQSLRRKS